MPLAADRPLATYNSLPGVKPRKSLKDHKTAASKIWERVEKLGQMVARRTRGLLLRKQPSSPKRIRRPRVARRPPM